MNIKLIKNSILSAAAIILVASCTGASNPAGGVGKAVGDAAVDSATKNVNPLTKSAIRNTTGYGTDPVEEQATGFLNSLTR